MIWSECLEKHKSSMALQFGEREANSMLRIIKEDYISQFDKGPTDSLGTIEVLSLESVVSDILQGKPIQYAIGVALFDGLKLKVSPDVLIPRPETEELLYWAKDLIENEEGRKYIDIGTGSGCLALGVKKTAPNAEVHALDKSKGAIEIAAHNAKINELPLRILCIDILDKSTWDSFPDFDGILSNPPYIPKRELELMGASVVKHEPAMALMVSDEDPLIFYRTIGAFAQKKLTPGGWLLFEINEFFGKETVELLIKQGFQKVELRQDMQGKDRMVACWK